jgi:Dyp-type peroxidase family
MILLADDEAPTLDIEIRDIKTSLAGIAVVLKEEIGTNITDIFGGKKRNIEHFGYADGISQPTYFTGVPVTSPFELQPLNILLVKDPFIENGDHNYGSFLVFRKLEQDIDGFNNKVTALSLSLNLNANQQGKITEEDYAGALAVGRFKDGAPLIKSDIPLDQAPAFNDFKYENTDRGAHKCPFHSHIRKANPRGQGVLVPERYITRRGIPYGQPNSSDKKGLLFMCFQSNLKRQFNFIQKTWANAPAFPPLKGRPGIDALIGQGHEGGQSWPIVYGSRDEIDFDFSGFINMKGGEYFFAPSISYLKNI